MVNETSPPSPGGAEEPGFVDEAELSDEMSDIDLAENSEDEGEDLFGEDWQK